MFAVIGYTTICSSSTGGRQYGRPPLQVLCYSTGPEAQTGDHPGFGLDGARALDPVLQVHPLQANQDHFLQGRRVRGPVQTGAFLSPGWISSFAWAKVDPNPGPPDVFCEAAVLHIWIQCFPTCIRLCLGAVLRAAGHQGGVHQPGEGVPAGDNVHRRAETPPHTPVLRRSQRAGEQYGSPPRN